MILALALSLAFSWHREPDYFRHGALSGNCFRSGSLQGYDHEFCRATLEFEPPFAGADIDFSADEVKVRAWPGSCKPDTSSLPDGHLPASEFAGGNRAAVIATFIRNQIDASLKNCGSGLKTPVVREADVARVLRETKGLRAGSFLLRNAADRAPFAAGCARELEKSWRADVAANPLPDDGKVSLMMYTMSEEGPDLAEKRFEAAPETMEQFFSMGMGPGGSMMNASKPVAAWRNPPSEWFVTICDIAVEAWSGFVELAVHRGGDEHIFVFTSRASTGVAGMSGYGITQRPPPFFPGVKK